MTLEQKNMLKAERVDYILQRLQTLYPNPPVPLDHTDTYTLLVAVLLSAQCTDERVNQVTPALFYGRHPVAPRAPPYRRVPRHRSGPLIFWKVPK